MSQGIRFGKVVTREQWEKNHKPTCKFYPCTYWREIHWHVGNNFIHDVANQPITRGNSK